MARDLSPELAALLGTADPASQDHAWSEFLKRYNTYLVKTTRFLSHDYDGAMDRYRYVLEELRRDNFKRLRAYAADPRSRLSTWLVAGFDNGSQATFRLGDDGPTLITHSTTFVSDKELVADVEVLADDEVGLRDVEVLTARGRKGIGIELFDVKNTGPPPPSAAVPLQVTFREAPDDGVLSDGQGVYIHEVDKVSAHLRENNGHFRLFTAFNLKAKEEATRKLCFDFGSGGGGIPESFTDGSGCDSASAGELMAKGMVTSNALDADGAPFPGGMLGMTPGNQITMRSSTYFEADGFGWTLRLWARLRPE